MRMERLLMKSMYMVYYTASWCQPCKSFRPQAEREAAERGIKIEVVDVDSSVATAGYDGIMTVPTILLVNPEGGQEIDRVVGASLPTLKKTLDNLARSGYNGQLVNGVN